MQSITSDTKTRVKNGVLFQKDSVRLGIPIIENRVFDLELGK
jgi:hypothetical protein